MPNNSKIIGEIADKAKQLSKENRNLSYAGKVLGVAKDTYKKWLIDNNLPLPTKVSIHQSKIDNFIQICQTAIINNTKITLNQTLRELGLHPDLAQITIKTHNLSDAIRSKSEAAIEDRTLTLEEAQNRLPNQSDKIIGFKDSKYQIKTEDGFIYYKSSAKIRQGDPRGKGGARLSIDYIHQVLKEYGYTLVDESYISKRLPLKAIHDKCGMMRENRFANFFTQGCPTCSNTGVSKQETELNQWIQSLGFETSKYRFKGKTKGKEIDVYIPSINLGIEYCGLHWHGENMGKTRNYHYDKMIASEQNGIRLVTIFEDEWVNRKEQVKGFLKSILNINDLSIYARNCTVDTVDKIKANNFIEQYHIQGKCSMKIAFGLYLQEELIGVITGNTHHHKTNQENVLVLNRLCFKDGIQVIGGASRLVKHLKTWAINNGYKKIISWSDNRYSQGNVYEQCGFSLDEKLPPDYSYIIAQNTRESKQSNRKEDLLRKGAIGTMDNTEKELALTLGYNRIWDCGKIRWLIKLD